MWRVGELATRQQFVELLRMGSFEVDSHEEGPPRVWRAFVTARLERR